MLIHWPLVPDVWVISGTFRTNLGAIYRNLYNVHLPILFTPFNMFATSVHQYSVFAVLETNSGKILEDAVYFFPI